MSPSIKYRFLLKGAWILLPTLLISSAVHGAEASSLERARAAYERAAESEARTLRPDRLLAAKRALEDAERLHETEPGSQESEHAAYLARRKAQVAEAEASAAAFALRRAQAERTYVAAQEAMVAMSATALSMLEQALFATQADLERTMLALVQVAAELEAESADNDALRRRQRALEARRDALDAELRERERLLVAEREARHRAELAARAPDSSAEDIARVAGREAETRIIVGGALLFEPGARTLRSDASKELAPLAAELLLQPKDRRIRVLAFSGAPPGQEQALSLARALAVRDDLIARGIAADRITVEGHAADESGEPEEQRWLEVVVESADAGPSTLEGRE